MGGADFNVRLASWIAEKASLTDLAQPEPWFDDLVESVKISLSTEVKVDITAASAAGCRQPRFSTGLTIERVTFEGLISDLVGRTVGEALRIVADEDLTPGDFDGNVLVGGSAHIPMIPQELSRAFDCPTVVSEPEWIVAKGAAGLALDQVLALPGPGARTVLNMDTLA